MKSRIFLLAIATAILIGPVGLLHAQGVTVTVDPGRVVNPIDEKVYGHFLEHIYHSVNGGLWGELVWNRSFEQNDAGQWTADGDVVEQKGMGDNQRLTFGDPNWTDYEFTLEAEKTGGAEGFLVLFRVENEKKFYWCNLGGWQNKYHQLERGDGGGDRWHPVGPRIDGRIEAGRWYKIKVRCEGKNIQIWLDGEKIIDFTDPDGHMAGMVGIGTWNTTARFRNLNVTSLDGKKTLFEGLPPDLKAGGVAAHWTLQGDGAAYLETNDPLNSDYAQRLVASEGETILAQPNYCLHKGETYTGSLWMRGDAPQGVIVRLMDGEKVVAEQKLSAPTDRWSEAKFALKSGADLADATLQIVVPGKCDVTLDQVSMMPQSWAEQGGMRPDLLEAIKELRPPVIRWPGGCFASPYRWEDAIGPQHERRVYPRTIWDDKDVNSFGIDEFVRMCRMVGAEPIVVINIGTKDWNGDVDEKDFIESACNWIHYCNDPADTPMGKLRAANGHPEPYNVKYWEIDNETWHMGAEPYAAAVRRFAPALRRADPSIKLAACGSAGYGQGGNGLAWNRVIIDQCADFVDYLSIHHYEDPNNFENGPKAYEAFFRQTGELIAKSKNPNLKIDVSEWNAQSTDWRTGLYCGGLLNAFERCGDVLEIGGPALFLRHVSATGWDNAFVNFDQCGWFPAPNYVVMKLWRDHYAPQRIALDGDAGRLNMSASLSEDGRTIYVKAVNPTEAEVPLVIQLPAGQATGQPTLELVAPGSLQARNTLEKPDAVKVQPGEVRVDADGVKLSLPPLSAGVVTVPLEK